MNEIQTITNEERMTSLQIAEITGRKHSHVMRNIRNMEVAWLKISESKFGLAEYIDAQGKKRPCYSLTKTECLYVATKFNDEARAKLVLRWEELEREKATRHVPLTQAQMLLQSAQLLVDIENQQRLTEKRTTALECRLDKLEQERREMTEDMFATPLSDERVPDISLRDKIRKLVNEYAIATNIAQQDVWHNIYSELYYKYHINLSAYKTNGKESKLDIAERIGCLPKIDAIISTMVYSLQKAKA